MINEYDRLEAEDIKKCPGMDTNLLNWASKVLSTLKLETETQPDVGVDTWGSSAIHTGQIKFTDPFSKTKIYFGDCLELQPIDTMAKLSLRT